MFLCRLLMKQQPTLFLHSNIKLLLFRSSLACSQMELLFDHTATYIIFTADFYNLLCIQKFHNLFIEGAVWCTLTPSIVFLQQKSFDLCANYYTTHTQCSICFCRNRTPAISTSETSAQQQNDTPRTIRPRARVWDFYLLQSKKTFKGLLYPSPSSINQKMIDKEQYLFITTIDT